VNGHKHKDAEAGKFATFTPVTWHGRQTPRRRWCVEGFIPLGNVTMLNGDGGLGKTLLAMQLQAAGALSLPWLGLPLEPIKSLGVYCEDDADELHRRMADIAAHYRRDLDALNDVHPASRVGEENLLVHFDKNDVAHPTALYQELAIQAADLDVRLIVLDSLHDLFGGNEIIRTHARQFIGLLRKLALGINGAVLLCAHPSVAGMNSGTGTSGSTGWNNAVRSRLYLTRPKDDDDNDDNGRVLKTVKSNYGPLGNDLEVTWRDGVFVRNIVDTSDPYGQAELMFLECLDKSAREGRHVSASPNSPSFAPKSFVRMPQAKALTKARSLLVSTGKLIGTRLKSSNGPRTEVATKKAPPSEGGRGQGHIVTIVRCANRTNCKSTS
jgi:RecA-family ATPase